jgi:hypothetical protein
MLDRRETFEVCQSSVVKVPISVMNVTTRGHGSESGLPNIAVKFTATSRRIAFARPETIQPAREIDGEVVKVDRIAEPLCRDCADVHPFSVKNK